MGLGKDVDDSEEQLIQALQKYCVASSQTEQSSPVVQIRFRAPFLQSHFRVICVQVDFQTINWQIAICLIVAWVFVFLCSFKSVKTSGKVVYCTVVLPYIFIFVLLVRFLTLPGSVNGVLHFFQPKWNVLSDLRVWGDAAVQVFYSLSTCTGGLTTLASYNRFHNKIFFDIWVISFVDFFTSMLVSSLVFSAVGFVCYDMDLLLDQFRLQEGIQLVFVFFAEALSKLPVAQLYSFLFFGMVSLVIFNSELFIVETVVSSICDAFPERLRKNHRHVLTFVLLAFYLLGLPLCTAAGIYWIVLLENFSATWPLIIIAFFEVMIICWVYGVDNFLDNIKWYQPLNYDSVTFPTWSSYLGWTISLSPLLIMLSTAIYMYVTASGNFSKKWRDLLCPENDWGPALAVHRAEVYPLQIPEARKLMPMSIPSRVYFDKDNNGAARGVGFNFNGFKNPNYNAENMLRRQGKRLRKILHCQNEKPLFNKINCFIDFLKYFFAVCYLSFFKNVCLFVLTLANEYCFY